jgi:hypothetical protein
MMDGNDLAEVAGAIGVFAFIITVTTVIIIQVAATMRARAALAREDEYRKLAESGADVQQGIERHLGAIDGRLATMEDRLVSLEKVLKTVE